MVNAVERELTAAGIPDTPELVLAHAGYWHQVQIESIVNRGVQGLIPPDASKRKGTLAACSAG